MSPIGAIGRALPGVFQPARAVPQTSAVAPAAQAAPVDRVDKLSRQLDATLTNRLERIRARITPGVSATATPAVSVDISV